MYTCADEYKCAHLYRWYRTDRMAIAAVSGPAETLPKSWVAISRSVMDFG